jgi:hypothetical protein
MVDHVGSKVVDNVGSNHHNDLSSMGVIYPSLLLLSATVCCCWCCSCQPISNVLLLVLMARWSDGKDHGKMAMPDGWMDGKDGTMQQQCILVANTANHGGATILCCCCDVLSAPPTTRQTMEEQQFCVAAAMCYQPHPQHGKPWSSNNFVLLLLRCVISPTIRQTVEQQQFCVAAAMFYQPHNTANHGASTILCCCCAVSAEQHGKPWSS